MIPSARIVVLAMTLAGCLGPGEAELQFVPVMEQAASQAILDAGATEATTRPIRAEQVQWILREHTTVVSSEWPAGRMNGTASIPVVVRFDKVDDAWTVTEVVPDAVGMNELRSRIGQAEERSAQVRKLQSSYDARVQAAHDAFTRKAEGGGWDRVFPDINHVEIRNCLVIATVPTAWASRSTSSRKKQLTAIGKAWTQIVEKNHVKCGDPGFRAVSVDGATLGSWSQSGGPRP